MHVDWINETTEKAAAMNRRATENDLVYFWGVYDGRATRLKVLEVADGTMYCQRPDGTIVMSTPFEILHRTRKSALAAYKRDLAQLKPTELRIASDEPKKIKFNPPEQMPRSIYGLH